MLQKMLILVALIFSFSTFAIATCPAGTQAMPLNLGSPYKCMSMGLIVGTFEEAEAKCNDQGGHLAAVPNAFVNTFLGGYIDLYNATYCNFWIGVDNRKDGVWRNINDGSAASYLNWAPGHPVKANYQQCAYLRGDGLWRSTYLYDTICHFCSVPPV
ncbi:hypothetical protein FO519_009530 [Halicephalobus sp. NKZ332]|nr:hypothetical protein FO519_009530 [Halicephalobus sp. NKZ332]